MAANTAAVDEVCAYLKEVGTYYLCTEDGDQPRVRPFGTAHVFEGRLYIQTGRKKDVYRQLKENPKLEICACRSDSDWLRVSGSAVEDPRVEAEKSLLDEYPGLQGMYQPGDGNNCVFYLQDATATFSSFGPAPRTVEF